MKENLVLFSTTHYISSLTVIFIIALSVFLCSKFKISFGKKYSVFLIIYYVLDCMIRNSVRELHIIEYLPLHICSILFFISAYSFYKESIIGHQITFFWTFSLTLQSLIFPIPGDHLYSLEFFRYFLTHGLIIFNACYVFFRLNIPLNFQSLLNSFYALQILIIIAIPFNYFFELNFMFLNQKPPSPTPVDFFGPWPWYVLVVDLITFMVFSLLLLLTKIISRIRGN